MRAMRLRSLASCAALALAFYCGCSSDETPARSNAAGSGGAAGTAGTAGAGGSVAGTANAGGTSAGSAGMPPSGAGGAAGAGGSGAGAAGGAAAGGALPVGGSAGAGGQPPLDPANGPWTLTSPGGVVRGTVELSNLMGTADYPDKKRLYYRVEVGGPTAFAEVLPSSPLGITRVDQDFIDDLVPDATSPQTVIDETYTLPTGKRSQPRNHAHEKVLHFHTSTGKKLDLSIRAYDDGFAFRYRFPETDAVTRMVTAEATGFRLPASSQGYILPYDAAGMYTPGYESYWQADVAAGTAAPATTKGWCLPALFKTPTNQWALLAESDNDGSYFGVHLAPTAASSVYRVALPLADEANATGVVPAASPLPWQTPWRIVMAGSSVAPIVESTLVTDLARPSVVADTSWIKPGRVSWSWWSDDASPSDYTRLTPFVDLAATMTWEYSLVDANWPMMTGGTWQGITSYAAAKNVGVFLWYNSGGPNNSIMQYLPRDKMTDKAIRQAEFATISQAGVKGVKVDFFLSDKPSMMQYYLDILKDAAAARLLVNFHGATAPRGWQRTYPNLMTMEAVKGAEEYKYSPDYPAGQPARNTIFPFTRNVIGSMDYTPVTFSDAMYPHVTTYAHELALSVIFESGLQHFADRASGYTSLPAAPREFLQQVPVAWDDTRFVAGAPGKSVVLARRKGTAWYVAGITGASAAAELQVPLTFLGAGSFAATLITDGASDRALTSQTSTVSQTSMLSLTQRANGGFVARLVPMP